MRAVVLLPVLLLTSVTPQRDVAAAEPEAEMVVNCGAAPRSARDVLGTEPFGSMTVGVQNADKLPPLQLAISRLPRPDAPLAEWESAATSLDASLPPESPDAVSTESVVGPLALVLALEHLESARGLSAQEQTKLVALSGRLGCRDGDTDALVEAVSVLARFSGASESDAAESKRMVRALGLPAELISRTRAAHLERLRRSSDTLPATELAGACEDWLRCAAASPSGSSEESRVLHGLALRASRALAALAPDTTRKFSALGQAIACGTDADVTCAWSSLAGAEKASAEGKAFARLDAQRRLVPPAKTAPFESRLDRARTLADLGRVSEARAAFLELCRERPESAEARAGLLRCSPKLDFETASALLRRMPRAPVELCDRAAPPIFIAAVKGAPAGNDADMIDRCSKAWPDGGREFRETLRVSAAMGRVTDAGDLETLVRGELQRIADAYPRYAEDPSLYPLALALAAAADPARAKALAAVPLPPGLGISRWGETLLTRLAIDFEHGLLSRAEADLELLAKGPGVEWSRNGYRLEWPVVFERSWANRHAEASAVLSLLRASAGANDRDALVARALAPLSECAAKGRDDELRARCLSHLAFVALEQHRDATEHLASMRTLQSRVAHLPSVPFLTYASALARNQRPISADEFVRDGAAAQSPRLEALLCAGEIAERLGDPAARDRYWTEAGPLVTEACGSQALESCLRSPLHADAPEVRIGPAYGDMESLFFHHAITRPIWFYPGCGEAYTGWTATHGGPRPQSNPGGSGPS